MHGIIIAKEFKDGKKGKEGKESVQGSPKLKAGSLKVSVSPLK